MRNDLPETCFAVMPGEGSLIILKRGEKGYYRSDWETGDKVQNKNIADWHNQRSSITPAQVMAMQVGSMYGFDVPGADPQRYFDGAHYVGSHSLSAGAVLYADDTLHEQVGGHVYQYQIAGETCFYLDPALIPESMMGKQSDRILQADMVHGEPLIPVTLKWMECNTCEMTLEQSARVHNQEINAGYQIIAKTRVGPVEYALGEMDGRFPSFVTWERTPGNDGDGPPNYYWGHYFDSRDSAIKDFCERASEKYQMLAENRKPSIKAQLAAKSVPGDKPITKPKEREVR